MGDAEPTLQQASCLQKNNVFYVHFFCLSKRNEPKKKTFLPNASTRSKKTKKIYAK
jgi:hypothetical protein